MYFSQNECSFEVVWISIDKNNCQIPVFANNLSQTSPEVLTIYPFSYIGLRFNSWFAIRLPNKDILMFSLMFGHFIEACAINLYFKTDYIYYYDSTNRSFWSFSIIVIISRSLWYFPGHYDCFPEIMTFFHLSTAIRY